MANRIELERLALSVEEASVASALGRSTLYQAISSGDLIARKSGRRTVILREELQTYLKALPRAVPDQIRNNFESGASGDE
jgi:excisionase family DNA binding protein